MFLVKWLDCEQPWYIEMSATKISSLFSTTGDVGRRRRMLMAACGLHAVHDGLTDAIYVLLPIWQSQFALSYAVVGLLRGVYTGAMAGLQLIASREARRFGRNRLLIGGTVIAGLAYLLAGQAAGLATLLLALAIGGLGASTQHPLASSMISDAYETGGGVKEALSQYNFAGDVGKTLIPGLVGLSLTVIGWRTSMSLLGVLGVLAAAAFWGLIREGDAAESEHVERSDAETAKGSGRGFGALLATGIFDSAGRMGFLTFLPFLLNSKGAGTAGVGLALTLLFVGGAFGKLSCGYLGTRIGMMRTVWVTESATALFIALSVVSPLVATMAMMPLLGVALNGTSSVLYGAVPELAAPGRREHAFALFYTGVIGGGALAPILFGRLGDAAGVTTALMVLAVSLLCTLPLSWCVQRHMGR